MNCKSLSNAVSRRKKYFTLWHCLVSAWIADRGKFHYYIITMAYYILWKRVSGHWIRWTKLPSLVVITQNRDLWRNLYRSLPYFVVRVRCGKESSRSLSHLLMSFLYICPMPWIALDRQLVHKFYQRSTRLCVGTQVYQSQWNSAMQRPLCSSRSFKVTNFSTNRKLIYDFPLVINTKLPHRFQVMADY